MNLPNQHRAGARTAAQTGRDIPTGKTGKNHWNSRQTSLNTSLYINKLRRGHHMSALWRKEFIRHSRLTPFTKLGVCAAHLAARQRDNNTPSAFSYSWGVKRGHLGRTSAPRCSRNLKRSKRTDTTHGACLQTHTDIQPAGLEQTTQYSTHDR